MILKEYQKRALETVGEFLQSLAEWRSKQAKVLEADPDTTFDWVGRAWEKTLPGRPYTPRRNGLGEPLPAFCLKVPTGGGKTLLAAKIIDLGNVHFRRDPRGLVLWVVPTTQIYNQTRRAFREVPPRAGSRRLRVRPRRSSRVTLRLWPARSSPGCTRLDLRWFGRPWRRC